MKLQYTRIRRPKGSRLFTEMKIDAYIFQGRGTSSFKEGMEKVPWKSVMVRRPNGAILRWDRSPTIHYYDRLRRPNNVIIIFYYINDLDKAFAHKLDEALVKPPENKGDCVLGGYSRKQLTYLFERHIVPKVIRDTVKDRIVAAKKAELKTYKRASDRFKREDI